MNLFKRKYKNNKLDKYDLSALEQKAQQILSLCVDVKTDFEVRDGEYLIDHHMPYLNPEKENVPDNWDVPDDTKEMVLSYSKELEQYAKDVIATFYSNKQNVKNILPLWLVFPTDSATTMGWRMGLGESYEIVYIEVLQAMTTEELSAYKKKYPAPEYMRVTRCVYHKNSEKYLQPNRI